YRPHVLVLMLVVHLLLGFRRLRERDYYRDDPLVQRVLGLRRLPDVCDRPVDSPDPPLRGARLRACAGVQGAVVASCRAAAAARAFAQRDGKRSTTSLMRIVRARIGKTSRRYAMGSTPARRQEPRIV